jgi:succinate dehydrogenase / fumarate reductase flavoprotein subunit
LWVDYDLMTTIDGLYAIGECNFADHGANRLGANSLLQTCVDGYFVLPHTITESVADDLGTGPIPTDQAAFDAAEEEAHARIDRLCSARGSTSARHFHRELGVLLWDHCGMSRNGPGLERTTRAIRELRERFWHEINVTGPSDGLNPELERASRVADFLELGELMCHDALLREESCGAHFREEFQTPDGEALRNDGEFAYVSAWEFQGPDRPPRIHKEPLVFEAVKPTVRSYK